MAQLSAMSPAEYVFRRNTAIIENGGLNAFIQNDDEPMSYIYLEQKLQKHMAATPVTAIEVSKVALYYALVANKSFQKAPDSLKKTVAEAKVYLRKWLKL